MTLELPIEEDDTKLLMEIDFEATKYYNKKKLQNAHKVSNCLMLTTLDMEKKVEYS